MSSNEEVENNVLKSVFLVTVNQGESGYTFLSKQVSMLYLFSINIHLINFRLAKNETTITTSDDR